MSQLLESGFVEQFGIPSWLAKQIWPTNKPKDKTIQAILANTSNKASTSAVATKTSPTSSKVSEIQTNGAQISDIQPTTGKSTSVEQAPVASKINCLVIEDSNNPDHQCHQQGKQADLLLKMLGAIGLTQTDFHCIAIDKTQLKSLKTQFKAKTILILSEDINLMSANVFDCIHPSEILKNPDLKREAWEVLKQLKQNV